MGNSLVYLLHNAKNAPTPFFSGSHGQHIPILDTPCKVCTHLPLPVALMGNKLLR